MRPIARIRSRTNGSHRAQNWSMSPRGQHIELGIAESNLFILLAALGLSEPLFGSRLLPIGTVYDPFISRGLDAMNYACYQDARFIIVGTPSGVSLAPEGGAHQSIYTPLIGMGQPGSDRVRAGVRRRTRRDASLELRASAGRATAAPSICGFRHARSNNRSETMTAGAQGRCARGRVLARSSEPTMRRWRLSRAARWCRKQSTRTRQLIEDIPGAGLMIVTSPDRLERGLACIDRTRPSVAHRASAARRSSRGWPRHRRRRASCDAVVDGRGRPAPHDSARRGSVRPVG